MAQACLITGSHMPIIHKFVYYLIIMKIFNCGQIRQIDAYTIAHEPVSSSDLMERAAGKLFTWIATRFTRSDNFLVFTGPGNNGGDGLALARMLADHEYRVAVFNVAFTQKTSEDWKINRARLENYRAVSYTDISEIDMMPVIRHDDIVVDAIFGSGLARPAEGLARDVISAINDSEALVVSVDMPSGLFCEDNSGNEPEGIINADYTLSFQFPKLAFFFPENYRYTGTWEVLPIGLHPVAIEMTDTPYNLITGVFVSSLLKRRNKFDHKGNYGHGLLIAGSYGKMGAAILGASAALRTGIGLLTCHIPKCGYGIVQTAVTESMVTVDNSDYYFTSAGNTRNYDSVGIGPGLGTGKETADGLEGLIDSCHMPMVLDADALNILGMRKELQEKLPAGSILTPHPKEFERLAGESGNSYERLMMQVDFASRNNCTVVVKGAHTTIASPDGTIWFNNTGNPGMATAGSGDALTGILLSLLAQGYGSEEAAIIGVHLHGIAGDIAASRSSYEAVIASDIINCIGNAFNRIREYE
jgi:ADP-dependent NAD(P)H-hydrate dehydratase / NAD(P)H-hydrate epimerase